MDARLDPKQFQSLPILKFIHIHGPGMEHPVLSHMSVIATDSNLLFLKKFIIIKQITEITETFFPLFAFIK